MLGWRVHLRNYILPRFHTRHHRHSSSSTSNGHGHPNRRNSNEESYELLGNGNNTHHRHHRDEDYDGDRDDDGPASTHPKTRRRRGSPNGPRRTSCLSCYSFTLRRLFCTLLSILILVILALLINSSGFPPSFAEYAAAEALMPQHNLSLPFPEGSSGRYVRFTNRLTGHGLNNVLQETLLLSHMAWRSGRGYVWEEYTWSQQPVPWVVYDFALRPSRIPLSAFIAGPTTGFSPPPAKMTSGSISHPRAISSKYWEQVCPSQKRIQISTTEVTRGLDMGVEQGSAIMQRWIDVLREIDEGCVELMVGEKSVWDFFLFNSDRILSLWPQLSTSPIITQFQWSNLVLSEVDKNIHLFLSPSSSPSSPPSPPSSSLPTTNNNITSPSGDLSLPLLLAAHLRRGDYIRHCPRLQSWGAPYMGFNQHPSLPDRFTLPHPFTSFTSLKDYYSEHCWPSDEQIISTLSRIRSEWQEKTGRKLERVFLMTNGWPAWVKGLEKGLVKDGWMEGGVKSSWDLELTNEGKWVSGAVDMAIAGGAEVFVGNGFSSLTSNAVALRMAKGIDPQSSRFW